MWNPGNCKTHCCYSLQEMSLGDSGEVCHAENPRRWLQILWERHLQVQLWRPWIGSTTSSLVSWHLKSDFLDYFCFFWDIFGSTSKCRCPDNSDVADVEQFRKFVGTSSHEVWHRRRPLVHQFSKELTLGGQFPSRWNARGGKLRSFCNYPLVI